MQDYPKTLAELKRYLVLGTKLKAISNSTNNKLAGKTRAINLVQTNSIRFEPLDGETRGSWLEFGKAKDYTFSPTGFTQFNDCDPETPLAYEYVIN